MVAADRRVQYASYGQRAAHIPLFFAYTGIVPADWNRTLT
jgi:hypothetical protein